MYLSNRRRLVLLSTVSLPVCGTGSSVAQENGPRGGTWALEFGISSNFTLANFDQTGVALRRQFESGLGLRAGLRLTSSGSNITLAPDTLGTRREADAHDVQFGIDCLWYPRPKADVGLFMGAGPLFRLGSADAYVTQDTGFASANESSTWSAGGNAFVGVEWVVHPNLGIHAEYGVTGIYTSRETTITSASGTGYSEERDDWNINFDSVLFGLSVYF